jgi:hypothetical protein
VVRIERVLTNGKGEEFVVQVEIDEGGARFDRAVTRLAGKALKTGHATALDGAFRVSVRKR